MSYENGNPRLEPHSQAGEGNSKAGGKNLGEVVQMAPLGSNDTNQSAASPENGKSERFPPSENQAKDISPSNGSGNQPPRRHDSWDVPMPKSEGPGWMEWLIDANPLYLISVLLMVLGLLLISREASSNNVTVFTVMAFFGIQNLYEIILVAMAIYLLRSFINPRHGKLLLIFVMVFMADLTFYQVRISAMDAGWGQAVSLAYLALVAVKLALVVSWLGITPRWERLVYPVAAFGIIYFAPQYVYQTMDSVGKGTGAAATTPFSGVFEIYVIWFLAGIVQLPVIVGAWRKSDLNQEVANPYLGSERPFYWVILLFPFFVLPFQLVQNVMADARAGNGAISDMTFNYLPYFLAGIFFIQAFIRKFLERELSLNGFDFWMLALALCYAVVSAPQGDALFPFGYINKSLVIVANIVVVFTRQNLYCAGLLAALVSWHFLTIIKAGMTKVGGYVLELSSVAWAGILMLGSFIFLGLGFLLSLKSAKHKTKGGKPSENQAS